MKRKIQWSILAAASIALVFSAAGCRSSDVYRYASGGQGKQFPLFTDQIVAIGRPDANFAKKLGHEHVVAFLGLKHTYILHKGGEELERMAQLDVDPQGIYLPGGKGETNLSFQDNAVWGRVTLAHLVRYERTIRSPDATIPDKEKEELNELEKAGFEVEYKYGGRPYMYTKSIEVEGVAVAPIRFSREQLDVLTTRRLVTFKTPSESDSNVARKIKGALLMPGAIALDLISAPAFLLGFYAVTLSVP